MKLSFLALPDEEEQDDGDPDGYVVSIGIAEEVSKRCRKKHEALGDAAGVLQATRPKGK